MTLYIPPPFRVDDRRELVEFVERNAFGTLVSSGPGGLRVSHIPFLVEAPADGRLRLLAHVARANDHWRALEQASEVVAIFHGPHAYVSPTWYEHHPAVPTWNYAVVHAHGRAAPLDEAELRALLARLAAKYEAGNAPPWRMEDLPEDYVRGMVKAIAGFAIEVTKLEGKFKLSQNRPGRDAERVAEALRAGGEEALAGLMREHPARSTR
ncbi:MAG TPA: FMN-binding negative transcriptional regulator [Usitatibacter sp.]|nr:FMN-binding negative transcriptional regulator [Usitatibacter sp.]